MFNTAMKEVAIVAWYHLPITVSQSPSSVVGQRKSLGMSVPGNMPLFATLSIWLHLINWNYIEKFKNPAKPSQQQP